ncbi:uncharacterized protein LOC113376616 [Ctenocephalides felis]|uniref:uncharacterized protein LOC113376616 n=1 Tax=Ctenocephalides felis TaxID=7515 RepID=UPI000E6E296C|nr:uncharacterized protein LOC113376616 [Ctenocephalides felis]
MLVQGVEQVMSSRAPSILDSPTLARVERARMRQESGTTTPERDSLQNNSLLARGGAIKRGLLWQQRDRLFSRWKERYFVLTRDYLHCFKRCTSGASNMGEFIFKVKLVDVLSVQWLNRKSYSAVCLDVGREGRVLLRAAEGLEDWFELLEECTLSSKERRRALRSSNEARSRASLAVPMGAHSVMSGGTIDSALEVWLLSRHKTLNPTSHFPLCDSVPDLSNGSEVTMRRPPCTSGGATNDFYRKPQGPLDHRLSLLTDIDLTGCDSGLDTPPSTCKGEVRPSSYRDVFFMAPPNMANESPRRAAYKHHKSMTANTQGTNSSGSTNCGNTNTGDSSSRGTMLTPGGSFRSNASNKKHLYNLNGNPSTLESNMKQETPKKNFDGYCENRNKYLDNEDETERYYSEKYYVDRPQNVHNYMNNEEVYTNGAALLREKYEHSALSNVRLQEQLFKHRDRSYSDIQMDKRQWRLKQEESNSSRRGSYLVHLPSRI